jgi:predicted outer membrane lipoprotein
MDLMSALGVTREGVLLAAGFGLLAAVLLAGSTAFRRRREEPRGLGLDDR